MSHSSTTFFILSAFLCHVVVSLNLPEKWERCKVSKEADNKRNRCLEQSLTKVLKDLNGQGVPELNVPDFDPLKIKKMTVGQERQDGPVSLKFTIRNSDVFGFSKIRIKTVKGKISSPKDWNMKFDVKARNISVVGTYKVDGKVLVLPIVGEGRCNITFLNVTAHAEITGQPKAKDEEFLKLTGFHLHINTTRMYLDLENLFNGDKDLGENMNKFLNEHWQILFHELRDSIQGELAHELMKYSKRILEKVKFKDIFIVEE